MALVEPGIGLLLWTTIAFLIVWVGLGKMAWKPILTALKEREGTIQEALDSSSKAQEEVKALKQEIEEMKKAARAEREKILEDAKDTASKLMSEKQEEAQREYDRILENAQKDIHSAKNKALAEVKGQVTKFSLEIAEKLLQKELADKKAQQALVEDHLKDVKFN